MFTGVVGVKDFDALWEVKAAKMGGNVASRELVTRENGTNVKGARVDVQKPLLDREGDVAFGVEEVHPFELGSTITEEKDDILPREKQVHVDFFKWLNAPRDRGRRVCFASKATVTAMTRRKLGRRRKSKGLGVLTSQELELSL